MDTMVQLLALSIAVDVMRKSDNRTHHLAAAVLEDIAGMLRNDETNTEREPGVRLVAGTGVER